MPTVEPPPQRVDQLVDVGDGPEELQREVPLARVRPAEARRRDGPDRCDDSLDRLEHRGRGNDGDERAPQPGHVDRVKARRAAASAAG